MDYPSKELLRRAIILLADNYDLDTDSFFVVVTKDGKDPRMEVTSQVIIGELSVKTLIPFMVQSIVQVCESTGMSPHDFIAQCLTPAFLGHAQITMRDLLPGMLEEADFYPEDAFYCEDEAQDKEEDGYIFVTNSHWADIKN